MPVDAKTTPDGVSTRDDWARTRKEKHLQTRCFPWAVLDPKPPASRHPPSREGEPRGEPHRNYQGRQRSDVGSPHGVTSGETRARSVLVSVASR
jgi:hypothetical protein